MDCDVSSKSTLRDHGVTAVIEHSCSRGSGLWEHRPVCVSARYGESFDLSSAIRVAASDNVVAVLVDVQEVRCVIASEGLGHNPLIQLYRNLTPQLRTEWEALHIIKKEQIRLAADYFGRVELN